MFPFIVFISIKPLSSVSYIPLVRSRENLLVAPTKSVSLQITSCLGKSHDLDLKEALITLIWKILSGHSLSCFKAALTEPKKAFAHSRC